MARKIVCNNETCTYGGPGARAWTNLSQIQSLAHKLPSPTHVDWRSPGARARGAVHFAAPLCDKSDIERKGCKQQRGKQRSKRQDSPQTGRGTFLINAKAAVQSVTKECMEGVGRGDKEV